MSRYWMSSEVMAAKNRARGVSRAATYMIEGEAVTYAEIAKRVGADVNVCRYRVGREQAKPGPLTWEGLSE